MLLQIVAEQEQQGKPILSTQLLHSILRFYGTAMEDMTAQYLEKSMEHLLRQQETMRAQIVKMMNATPMADLLDIARQNMNLWGDLQKRMFGLGHGSPAKAGRTARQMIFETHPQYSRRVARLNLGVAPASLSESTDAAPNGRSSVVVGSRDLPRRTRSRARLRRQRALTSML